MSFVVFLTRSRRHVFSIAGILMNKTDQHAFTLIELLIVLIILAILASLATYGFQQYFRAQEVKNTQLQLIQAIQFARIKSMQHSHHVVICGSKNQSQCTANSWQMGFLIFSDKNNNRQLDSNEKLLTTQQFQLKYATLTWSSLNTQNLSFMPNNGRPVGSNGSFHYCSTQSKFNYALAVSNVGHTRIHNNPSC